MKKQYSEPKLNMVGAFTEDTQSLQSGDIGAKLLGMGSLNGESSEPSPDGGVGPS